MSRTKRDIVIKEQGGRPTVFTPDVLQKLETAFAYSYSDEEACLYAGISPRALYYYQEKNPEFLQRKQALRLTPNLSAKKELVDGIKGNLEQARWWAQNKMKGEFGGNAPQGGQTNIQINNTFNLSPEAREAVELFEESMRNAVVAPAQNV